MEKMNYEKPALNEFCGWDSEFAAGASDVMPETCDFGAYVAPSN